MDNINDLIINETEESIELRIQGENYLELDAMVDSLKTISTLLKIYTKDNYSKTDIKVIVEKIEPGNSITAFLKIFGQIIGITGTVVSITTGILNLYKFKKGLKGKKPISIETKVEDSNNVIVRNHVGDKQEVNINIFNTYINNPEIDKALTRYGKELEKNNRIGFVIKETNLDNPTKTRSIEFDDKDIKEFAVGIPVHEIDVDPEEITTIETLNLVIPKYNSSAMWEFINSDGNRIQTTILDLDFLDRINSGLVGTTGKTEMEVELLTKVNKGLTVGDRKLKTRYYIVKVIKIINPLVENETTLFDFDFTDE